MVVVVVLALLAWVCSSMVLSVGVGRYLAGRSTSETPVAVAETTRSLVPSGHSRG
jgi:hypothetical protein